MIWRQAGGSVLMAAGGAVVFAMLALAAIVGATFIEPANAGESVLTIAIIVVPPMIGGVTLIAIGRAVFGAWSAAQPLRIWGGRALIITGLCVAVILGVMLLVSLPRGFGEDNKGALLSLALGVLAGVLLAYIGRRLSRS